MTNKELNTIIKIKNNLDDDSIPMYEARSVKIEDPLQAVETSLMSFLNHRFKKITDDVEFENIIKEAMLARLPEANYAQLLDTLDVIQRHTNNAAEKITTPFMVKQAEMVNQEKRELQKADSDVSLFESKNTTKDVLQGLQQLSAVLNIIQNKKE